MHAKVRDGWLVGDRDGTSNTDLRVAVISMVISKCRVVVKLNSTASSLVTAQESEGVYSNH